MATNSIPHKPCSKCKVEKPATLEFFVPEKRHPTGIGARCRECAYAENAARNKRRYDEDPEFRRQRLQYEVDRVNNEPDFAERKKTRNRDRQRKNRQSPEYRAQENEKQRKRHRNDWNNNPKFKEKQDASNRRYAKTPKGIAASKSAQARYHARKGELPSDLTAAQWLAALEYFNGRCAVCGRPLNGLFHKAAQDHWIPITKGGGTTVSNIIPLCHGLGGCNNSKQNRDATEWLIDRFGEGDAKEILQRIKAYFEWATTQ